MPGGIARFVEILVSLVVSFLPLRARSECTKGTKSFGDYGQKEDG